MATSPPPPGFASLPNPKKRPSISSTISSASAAKRRQTLHPLRQTSFPAVSANTSASFINSAAASVPQSARSETGSAFSATSSRVPGRGRGRPPKNRRSEAPSSAQEAASGIIESASQVSKSRGGAGAKSTTAKSVISARSGARTTGPGDDENEEEDAEDSDDDPDDHLGQDEALRERDEDQLRAERERRLASTLEGDAERRYASYRSLKIDKKTVRRLINAVMSQSANEKVIFAVQFTSKLFVGAIIEGARVVQREWAEAYEGTRAAERKWRVEELKRCKARKEVKDRENAAVRAAGGGVVVVTDQETHILNREIARLEKETTGGRDGKGVYIPNPHRGGLLPEHLRESLRRYRADGEGFGAGEQGSAHPLLGVPGGMAGRLGMGGGGRRLFR